MDKVRRYVFAVRREILSMTYRFRVLMLLDLFFAGLPSLSPPTKVFILRGGAERALLPTRNLALL